MKPPPAVSQRSPGTPADPAKGDPPPGNGLQANHAQNNRGSGPPSNRLEAVTLGIGDGPFPRDLAESRRLCRKIAKSNYENFLVATVLLPRRLRQAFHDVYAFCRLADDLADESGSPEIASERLSLLEQHLEGTFNGNPPGGIFLALQQTILDHRLLDTPFRQLVDAFRQDQAITRYDTEEQLLDYCRRSANPVGHLVLQLGGCDAAGNRPLSDDICTALQLANFLQDVSRDYRIGRIYLPRSEMERHGVTEEMFRNAPTAAPLRRLLSEQCDQTEARIRRGLPLADRVPPWLAADVRLFAHGGLATLQAIRDIDFDVLAERPVVSRWKQMRLLTRAAIGRL